MILKRIFARKLDNSTTLYGSIVAAARQEKFYAELGVPDTVGGRFDMIILHLFLLLDRLKGEGAGVEKLRQALTDTFFRDMDRSLREMGVGDLSVGKKVRKMAEAFYGRVKAYAASLESGEGLQEALRRNIHPENEAASVSGLLVWVEQARVVLRRQSVADIMDGKVVFP